MKTSLYKVVVLLIAAVMLISACAPAAPAVEVPAVEAPVAEAPAAPAAEAKVFRIASDATWPPFETIDETTKEMVGFDIDLIKAIAEEAGFEYELVNVAWDALLAGVSECQYDAAISSISITEERKISMNFSEPYATAGQVVTIGVDNTEVTGFESLTGKRIGVQLGTTGDFAAQKVEGAEIKSYDTVDLAFQDLMNKQVDAVIADLALSADFVLKNPDKIKLVGAQFTDEALGVAVCKNNTELLDQINKGLAAVQASGKLDELKTKWFGGVK
ncbi:MAG: basic amino acid ABC transporter substrate-binding protein [Anaerolinea sp.]|nr:basic amino acid ABC transporter substrate-binding protein [Anaerolinea sp.]